MYDPSELDRSRHWRTAVWALRVGYAGLAVVMVGLLVLWSGSTPWVLAVGVGIWLACAGVMATGFVRTLGELPEPRPGFWPMRAKLLRDTVHARPTPDRD